MALLSFLGNDVGGTTEGPQQYTGKAGIGQTGITWGELLAAAFGSGNKQSGMLSTPQFGQLGSATGASQQYGGQVPIYSLQPGMPISMQQGQGESPEQVKQYVDFFKKIFAGQSGTEGVGSGVGPGISEGSAAGLSGEGALFGA